MKRIASRTLWTLAVWALLLGLAIPAALSQPAGGLGRGQVLVETGWLLTDHPPGLESIPFYTSRLGYRCEPAAEVSVEEAARLVRDEAAFLLDVREPWEWEITRIPGAVLIPKGQVAGRVSEIPTDRPIVVYCAVGQRSAETTALLRERGYGSAVNLTGGIVAWANAQLPVEPDDGRTSQRWRPS